MTRPKLDRAGLTSVLADHVIARGLGQTSLRQMARAVGTSDRMLLYYFADKEALLTAVLAEVANRLAAALDRAIPAQPTRSPAILMQAMARISGQGVLAPYLKIWTEMMVAAAAGQAPFATLVEAIGAQFIDWIRLRLDPDWRDRPGLAALLMAVLDGAVLLQPLNGGAHAQTALAAMVALLDGAAHPAASRPYPI